MCQKKKKKEKEGRDTKREQVHTHSKNRERIKKRGTGRESNIKQRRIMQHRFVYRILMMLQ